MVETSLCPHIDDFRWFTKSYDNAQVLPYASQKIGLGGSMSEVDQSRLSGSDPPPRALELGRPHGIPYACAYHHLSITIYRLAEDARWRPVH